LAARVMREVNDIIRRQEKDPCGRPQILNHTTTAGTCTASSKNPLPLPAMGFLRQTSRGDWTPLELFLAGVRGWEAYPRRRLDDGKPVEHVA
jgi:hypothetical protein